MIWMIDDDPDSLYLTSKALQRLGHGQFRSFENPEEAILLANHLEWNEIPRIVVSDLNFPSTDGISLLAEIHQVFLSKGFPAPILVLVSAVFPDHIQTLSKRIPSLRHFLVKSSDTLAFAQSILQFKNAPS